MGQNTVTLEVVKLLIQNQTRAFKSIFAILLQDMKNELKGIKSETSYIKVSFLFTQAHVKDDWEKANSMDTKIGLHSENLNVINDHADKVELQLEYIGNKICRNNVKILGLVEDKDEEKTWNDTENVVRKALKDKLHLKILRSAKASSG